jgi:hypothetical protein
MVAAGRTMTKSRPAPKTSDRLFSAPAAPRRDEIRRPTWFRHVTGGNGLGDASRR